MRCIEIGGVRFLAAHSAGAGAVASGAAPGIVGRGGPVGPGQAVRINGQLVTDGCPFPFTVVFDEGDKRQALDFRADHTDHARIVSLDGGEGVLLRHPETEREGHGSFQATLLAHGALKVEPAAPVLKLEPDRHGTEAPLHLSLIAVVVDGENGFSLAGGLSQKFYLGGAAQGVRGQPHALNRFLRPVSRRVNGGGSQTGGKVVAKGCTIGD